MSIHEIVLPATVPETEWVRGRALRKMSPTRDHSRVQTEFASSLNDWSRGRGEVGTEWRFRLALPGEARRPLVPDVAFVAKERLRGLSLDDVQAPIFAPTVAVEVLSIGDDALDVSNKVDVYLRAGSELVIVIDPGERSMALYDRISSLILRSGAVLRHEVLPGFEIELGSFFATALDLPE